MTSSPAPLRAVPDTDRRHPSDDELVLHYYADPASGAGIDAHVRSCRDCAERFDDLSAVLDGLPAGDVPERDDAFGQRMWDRVRRDLPVQDGRGLHAWHRGNRAALAAAAALLLVVGFSAGRLSERSGGGAAEAPVPPAGIADAFSNGAQKRVLLTVVADHLERSDRLLMDVMNADDGGNLSPAQQRAEELLWAGRFYRQDAAVAGERSIAAVLDDLERTLLDIAHGPAEVHAADLESLRGRVDSAALLFKLRVLRDELRQDETPPSEGVTRTSIPISRTS